VPMFDFDVRFHGYVTQVSVRLDLLRDVGLLIRTLLRDSPPPMVVVVTDDRVGPLYAESVLGSLAGEGFETLEHRIRAGEESKSLAVVEGAYESFVRYGVSRDAVVLALGGGVVSDLAGFLAATWMRGVRFVVCPTTLEADIDASLGGKTAINVPGGKNLVGAFHQPVLVAVDPRCLGTLDARDVRAGMAESVKHALISSEEFLAWQEDNIDSILALDDSVMTALIERNLRIKADVVTRDAREQHDVRILLNLGHTVGHAIEECSRYSLRHGECVSLGMLAACRLSASMGLLDGATAGRIESLLSRIDLPTRLAEPIETEAILETIRRDKKVRQRAARLVLLEGVGRPVVRDDISETQLGEAYESLLT